MAEEDKSYKQLLAGLTGKQRQFVKAYVQEPNATKAAKSAGYSQASAHSIGSENLRKPEIVSAIEAGLAQFMGKNEVLARTAEIASASFDDFLTTKTIRYTDNRFLDIDEALDLISDAVATFSEELESAREDRAIWLATELRRLHRLSVKCHRASEKADQEDELQDGQIGPDGKPRRAERTVLVDVEWKERTETFLDLEKARERGKLHLIHKLKETKYGLQIELYSAADARELLGKHYKLWSDRLTLENPDGSAIKFIVGLTEDEI